MGRAHKLTPLQVDRAKVKGVYGDGAGLCLNVTAGGSKSWLFRFMQGGKAHWMGLGSYPDVSLAEAREKAAECRKQLRNGIDPLTEKRAHLGKVRADSAKYITFDECAKQFIESHRTGWRNAKHAQQWENTLAAYASPIMGSLGVSLIETSHVLKVIEPIWKEKAETANRLRGRLESILDWAKVRGYRTGENPATWRGHLDKILPARSKVAKVQHHDAMPWQRIGAFVENLRKQKGVSPRAVEFVILTAARSGEVRGARWSEIDMDAKIWTVPAERMKAGIEHRVPLTESAIKLLQLVKESTPASEIVFPGSKGTPLSDVAVTNVLRNLGEASATVHGFRSTFRDWAGESTGHPRETIEHALAHQLRDKAEAAYARGTHFDKRHRLMDDWAKQCETVINGDNVVHLKTTAAA